MNAKIERISQPLRCHKGIIFSIEYHRKHLAIEEHIFQHCVHHHISSTHKTTGEIFSLQ